MTFPVMSHTASTKSSSKHILLVSSHPGEDRGAMGVVSLEDGMQIVRSWYFRLDAQLFLYSNRRNQYGLLGSKTDTLANL